MQATGIATINERLALVRRLRDRLADDANAIDALQAAFLRPGIRRRALKACFHTSSVIIER
jgi:hypothetical protein